MMRKWSLRIFAYIFCFIIGTTVALIKLSHPFEKVERKSVSAVKAEPSLSEWRMHEISALGKVDFYNFTYPAKPIYSDGSLRDVLRLSLLIVKSV
jgi:hypothetical protein